MEVSIMQRITPFLWFDDQAEAAANYYVSVFENARIGTVARYGKEGAAVSGRTEGSVMTVAFELDGQKFVAINGGPHFKINEAVSFVVNCESQEAVDYYWDKLGQGGDPTAQRCGWLKDKFGVSWQVVPTVLPELMSSPRASNVMQALLQMSKLDIAALKRASEN
jgi:predicted 3-demethylubiquinone-9 3-methyltransferase (glyoxalase superfamily)